MQLSKTVLSSQPLSKDSSRKLSRAGNLNDFASEASAKLEVRLVRACSGKIQAQLNKNGFDR